jgi:hypothetical protein
LEERWFTGGSILQLKVKTIGLAESLGTDASLEFDNLIIRTKLLLVGSSQGDGSIRL